MPPISPRLQLVEAELAAGQSQDHRVLRRLLGKLGVVVAARFGAVAAADQEEVLDRSGLDRLDHLVGDAENGIVAEAGEDLLPGVVGEALALLGLLDHLAEKSHPSTCLTPGHCTRPQVKRRSL